MSRRLALTGLALLLMGLLALIFTGLVQEVLVVPLLYLLWLGRVLLESIPQVAIWAGLLALAVPVIWRSLAGPRPRPPRTVLDQAARPPVAAWTELFVRAKRDHYARWLLAQRLAQLASQILADHERAAHPWQYMQDESLDMPPAIRAYFRAGLRAYQPPPRLYRLWPTRARRPLPEDPLDLDPEVVLRFLEDRRTRTTGETL